MFATILAMIVVGIMEEYLDVKPLSEKIVKYAPKNAQIKTIAIKIIY